MSDRAFVEGASKRQFLRTCLWCAGGIAAGWSTGWRWPGIHLEPPGDGPGDHTPGKWSKEALYYTVEGSRAFCKKCPHECVLDPGESGRCRSRTNVDGKLYSIAYGNPCAVHVDPIEKKPFFHFHPSTRAFSVAIAGCNLRCLNCQNWEISQVSPRETTNYDLMPSHAVEECQASGSPSIAYTYSEPTTFYEYVLDTATLARRAKIKNLLKSSGYIHEEPLRRLCRVLDAANIDLKSFDADVYQRLCGVRLAPVLRTLTVLHEEGVWLEITHLVIPGWTDNLEKIRLMCQWLVENGLAEAPLHFSRFSPLYKLAQLPLTPVSTLEHAREIALKAGVHYVYIGNVPGHEAENTYCYSCKKLLVRRRGYVVEENNILGGKCRFCGRSVPGVWS
jgi:pyruvate formate lyase activating enzyme